MNQDFQTPGYEKLQLSTQVVVAAALEHGIEVEVLDWEDNIIRLTKDGRSEIIKEATKTSLDSYVTSEVLGNKWVSKQIMKDAGVRVPEAKHYDSPKEALAYWSHWQKAHVIKPKNTNYGIGISIFEEAPSETQFEAAVNKAFDEDSAILIEEFLPGIECRFLVMGNECIAVLQRIPANVIGNGKLSIQELLDMKNSDPRRGKGYKTPLEIIELGETELGILKEQGLTPDSIPEEGQQIFLRKNSNISTGGDSIDRTDSVHPAYKEVAVQATQAVDAAICGVDIILNDPESAPTPQNHGVIEVNYNPVLYFHNFPYQGENRQTGEKLLALLKF